MSAAEERDRAATSTRARRALLPVEQSWLVARLEEYRELLEFLHDH
jgi:hypothetical protein